MLSWRDAKILVLLPGADKTEGGSEIYSSPRTQRTVSRAINSSSSVGMT
jgi:hypothetical protein